MRRLRRQPGFARRRGTLMPAIIVAIAVVCLCAALVFDRLWLDAARIELRTAAEAAAFAAAGRLVNDDRLRADSDTAAHLAAARQTAAAIAAENRVAGSPVRLDSAPGSDVRFGRVIDDPLTRQGVFLETDYDPTTVLVTAQAVRSRGNGVALFFRGLTGVATGNVIGRAGVTLDNAVVGVRPLPGVLVPALPLGILETDPTSDREDTWDRQIVQRAGADQYGFDESLRRVTAGPDGIPEITLTSNANRNADQEQSSPNGCIVDVGNGLYEPNVRRQIGDGWSPDDLAYFDGQLLTDGSAGIIDGSSAMLAELADDFAPLIGQPRICVLYREDRPAEENGIARLLITQLAAGRVLSINDSSDSVQIVFQPAVVTTPTAVLAGRGEAAAANPYIYKLHLTH